MSVYLDWNATAPPWPQALAAWQEAQATWGNPSSIHAFGQRARMRLDAVRAALAGHLGCRAEQLVAVSGGSEANALAIHAALHAQHPGPGGGGEIPTILASAVEHSSVLRNAERAGRLRVLPVDGDGRVAPETLLAHLHAGVRLVCLQWANNEIGTASDLAALVAAIRASPFPDLPIHLDACQGPGKEAFSCSATGCDTISFAGHKCGAPKGIGLLYVRRAGPFAALIAGGRQQQDRRSGTEDLAGLSALAAALEAGVALGAGEVDRQRRALGACFERIAADLPECRWLGQSGRRLANTMNLVLPGVASAALVARLDLAGFAVSSGAACMAARGAPSHVLAALGLDADLAASGVRVSIGWSTSEESLQAFAAAYVREARALRERRRPGGMPRPQDEVSSKSP